jgi:hypothetical protein
MFLVDAKENGFLETVVALLEKIRNFLRNELGAVINDEGPVKILGVVDSVLDLIALAVGVTPLRPVTSARIVLRSSPA